MPDGAQGTDRAALAALTAEIVACRRCPRLVAWRELVAREKVARFRDEDVLGPAGPGLRRSGRADPARSGSRRRRTAATGPGGSSPATRRGTSCGAALHRAGLADRPVSRRADDGLTLTDVYIAAAVRCAPPANKPTILERDTCAPFLVRELALLGSVRVVLALGAFGVGCGAAGDGRAGARGDRGAPRFGHGAEARVGPYVLLGSYHPSQQNTFTGRLTPPMFDAVIARAVELADESPARAIPKSDG